jgi:HPt (histidine-containing phosphotransfer) domain-containing protein
MAQMLAMLWQKNRPTVAERVLLLRESHTQLATTGALTPQHRTDAASAAHKLAGVLGTFGFPQGTEAARKIEHLLEADPPAPDEAEKLLGWLQELEQILAVG